LVAAADPSTRPDIDALREHDRDVLEFLSRVPASSVGFQGLRRRLRIHPEQLSRALQRLARDDLITKTALGYRVGPKALSVLSPDALPREASGVPILQTYVPGDVNVPALVQSLKGSWIGPLRWYALSEAAGGTRVTWATEDEAIQLDVEIGSGRLAITADVVSPDRLDEAARLGHQLFQHIAREASHDAYAGLSG